MLIGIIDSGLGGLGYLKLNHNENDRFILVMDQAFFPYGEKSVTFLRLRCLYLVEYLLKRGANKVILACNTLSLVALPFINMFYPQVEGIFERIEPYLNNPRALLLGSKRLIDFLGNEYICKKLDSQNLINDIQKKKTIDISFESGNIDSLILGCSHFLYVLEYLPKGYKLLY